MKYIESTTDMIMKYEALFGMLTGQIAVTETRIKEALIRCEKVGDNDRSLILGFFTLLEAIEKVVEVQMVLSDKKKPNGLIDFIKKTKATFKALDVAATKNEEDIIDRAVKESESSTFH